MIFALEVEPLLSRKPAMLDLEFCILNVSISSDESYVSKVFIHLDWGRFWTMFTPYIITKSPAISLPSKVLLYRLK